MTRPPNPDSKVPQILVRAHPGEEDKLRAFKEIHARNGLQYRKTIMAEVDRFLIKHNYPPGNSQVFLSQFDGSGGGSGKPTCDVAGCDLPARWRYWRGKEETYRCGQHKLHQIPWGKNGFGSEKVHRL